MRKMIVVAAAMAAMIGMLAGCNEGTSRSAGGGATISPQTGSETKMPTTEPSQGSAMKGDQGPDMPAEGGSGTK